MTRDLRSRAEEFLDTNPKETPTVATADVKKLVHELAVHQIELEMQNEELREAQMDLAQSRDGYAELYDFAPVGYVTVDRDGTILEANHTAATMFSADRRNLLRRNFSAFIEREAQDEWFRHRRLVLASKEKQSTELALVTADGKPFIARLVCRPRPGASAPDWRCLVAVIDITLRVQVEEELRRLHHELEQRIQRRTGELAASEARYRGLVENTLDIPCSVDAHGRIRYLGPQVKNYGLDPADLEGRRIAEVVIEEDREGVARDLERALVEGKTHPSEFRVRAPDGAVYWIEERSSIQRDAAGVVTGFVGVLRDITERKWAELKLEGYQADLRRLSAEVALAEERERLRIAGDLHDELGQMLAMCLNELTRLGQEDLSDKAVVSAARLRGFLDQAIADTRELTYTLSSPLLHTLGLASALEQLCLDLEREHGMGFVFQDDGAEWDLNEANRIVVFRFIRELLINVTKHARASEARCFVSRHGDVLRAVVCDDGAGFDTSEAGKGFSPKGGYGLFNMREYVHHVGGRLEMESSQGDGTRVVLEIPLGN